MYPTTLYPKTKQVLDKVKEIPIISKFYLAGGTGLALQLGHRKSIDLDFFIRDFPKKTMLLSSLSHLNPRIIQDAPGTLDLIMEGVKVSFLEYKYPFVDKLVGYEGIEIASVSDIACMKITAISSRGSKKDFYDFFFLLKGYSLEQLLTAFNKKYESVKFQELHILKSLVYFADAENDPDPDLMKQTDWKTVKNDIVGVVKSYADKII